MKRNRLHCLVVLLILAYSSSAWSGNKPVAGQQLIDIRLPIPVADGTRAYLGLSGSGLFDPLTVSGRLLIIEIFSMYCPHCQREAPAVNRLYESIEASKTLRNQVKLIGIGVGNSDFEVEHFRKHYKIEFPLFSDENFSIHQDLGEVRTPYFIIVAIGSETPGTILWTGSGNMDPVDTFIQRLSDLLIQRGPQ